MLAKLLINGEWDYPGSLPNTLPANTALSVISINQQNASVQFSIQPYYSGHMFYEGQLGDLIKLMPVPMR